MCGAFVDHTRGGRGTTLPSIVFLFLRFEFSTRVMVLWLGEVVVKNKTPTQVDVCVVPRHINSSGRVVFGDKNKISILVGACKVCLS